jgi:SAM-dependent methyltransferase
MSIDFDEEFYQSTNPDVVLAIKRGLVRNGWEHYMRFGKDEGRLGLPPEGEASPRLLKEHRNAVLKFVSGTGIEVGALDRPCPVPEGTRVIYCDRFTPEGVQEVLAGLQKRTLSPVERVLNLDKEGLGVFEDESLDFSMLCNVLQHLANPIRCLEEAFRVVKPGGHVVLSVPDHRFSFEASRPATAFQHVMDEYLQGVTEVSDAHYVDLLVLFCPSEISLGVAGIAPRLTELRRRMEHAHVWDTTTFAEFLKRSMRVTDVEAETVFEATGDDTRSECFVILRKTKQMLR